MKGKDLVINIIPEKDLVENPWNPNVLSDHLFQKLRSHIRREGFLDPILVRKLEFPKSGSPKDQAYQIIDGAHRVRAGREEGMKAFPCVVLENVSDSAAKFLTLNLNDIRGQDDPSLLSRLLQDLHEDHDVSLEDLSDLTIYEEEELRRYLDVEEEFRDLDPESKILPFVLSFEFESRADFDFAREEIARFATSMKITKEIAFLRLLKERG